jgi:D-alanyl-D-alanine carboxypeptidase (penicillin-binding protein 5/6)
VGKLPTYDPSDETLGLAPGEVMSVGDLVKASLIPSDNDAADALAVYDAGSLDAFITKMNAKLKQWGISGAHFNSAEGLTDDNNYATAVALAKIAKLALVNPTIASDVRLSTASISDSTGKTFTLTTTDELLASGQFYGIKTGYTDAAGQCFVGLANVNGHDVITVVLHSSDRFGDTMRLLNWIQGAWQWQ